MGKPVLSVINPIKNIGKWEINIINNFRACNTFKESGVEFIFVYSEEGDESINSLIGKLDCYKNCIFRKDHGNSIYSAMNKGIEESNGEYIIFMGSDDTFIRKSIELMLKKLEGPEKYDLILAEMFLSTDKISNQFSGNKFGGGIASRIHWFLGSPRVHQAMVYRRNFILVNKIRYTTKLRVTSDYIFTSEVCSLNPRILKIDRAIVIYNINGFSSNFSLAYNYYEHIVGFIVTKRLRLYLPFIIVSRSLLLILRGLKSFLKAIYKKREPK